MAGLWRNNKETKGGKYLVTRRDGTNPTWPYFVLGARDMVSPVALRAYADEAEKLRYDSKFVEDVRQMALEFENYFKLNGAGDPDAPRHRKDDSEIVAKMCENL